MKNDSHLERVAELSKMLLGVEERNRIFKRYYTRPFTRKDQRHVEEKRKEDLSNQ